MCRYSFNLRIIINIIIMKRVYKTADEAFKYLYDGISDHGIDYANTKTLFNIGFYIEEPWNNKITTKFRKWNEEYAEAEWLAKQL